MQEEFSQHSMLRSGLPMSDRALSSIIYSVERPIRAMCRVMQVYEIHACNSLKNVEQDYEDLSSVFSAFYHYVDFQMNRLSEMSEELETELLHVSIEKIRESEDFQPKKLPREAFNSEEMYKQYSSRCDAARASRSASANNAPANAHHRESPFNDAFGDSVTPENKIRGGK